MSRPCFLPYGAVVAPDYAPRSGDPGCVGFIKFFFPGQFTLGFCIPLRPDDGSRYRRHAGVTVHRHDTDTSDDDDSSVAEPPPRVDGRTQPYDRLLHQHSKFTIWGRKRERAGER
jgi:hypothetical protein